MEELKERALYFRQCYIWDDINDDSAHRAIHELSYLASLNKQDIVLLIHSEGGDIESASAIIDEMQAIQRYGIRIKTIAMGLAYSAAACILALGTKGYRMARPHSSIMLHPCSISLSKDYESNQVACLNHITKASKALNHEVARACGKGQSYKKFLNDIDKGLWLNAQGAVNYGVIDKIWTKPLPIGGTNDDKKQDKEEESD